MDKTILIVDDDTEIRDIVHVYLRNEGFQVMEASDGMEALQLFAAGKHSSDYPGYYDAESRRHPCLHENSGAFKRPDYCMGERFNAPINKDDMSLA